MSISERLKEAREEAGYKFAADFATKHGIHPNTYRNHENGFRGIKTPQAEKYAKLLKVSVSWLLTGENEPEAPSWNDRMQAVASSSTTSNIPVYRARSDVFFLSEENIVEVTAAHPAQNGLTNALAILLDTANFTPRYYKGEKLYIQTARSPMNGQDAIIIDTNDQVTIIQMISEDQETVTARDIATDKAVNFNKADIKDIYLICGTGI